MLTKTPVMKVYAFPIITDVPTWKGHFPHSSHDQMLKKPTYVSLLDDIPFRPFLAHSAIPTVFAKERIAT